MKLINFSHPITPEQYQQIDVLGYHVHETSTIRVQVDQNAPLAHQIAACAWQALSVLEQGEEVLVNLPGLSIMAAPIYKILNDHTQVRLIRLAPVQSSIGTHYVVYEILT